MSNAIELHRRRAMEQARASLASIAKEAKQSKLDLLLICDVSGSMNRTDCVYGRRRIDVLRDAIANLEAGSLIIVAFSDSAWVVNEIPEPGGSTNMAAGIAQAKIFCLGRRVILLSDGEPDNKDAALAEATSFGQPISTIYCGPEGGAGEDFLRKLSSVTGGKFGNLPPEKATAEALKKTVLAMLPPPK